MNNKCSLPSLKPRQNPTFSVAEAPLVTLLQPQTVVKFDVKYLPSAWFLPFSGKLAKKLSGCKLGSATQAIYFSQPHVYFKCSRVNVISHSSDTLELEDFFPPFPLSHTYSSKIKLHI